MVKINVSAELKADSTCKKEWPVIFSLLQREVLVVCSGILLPSQGVFAVGDVMSSSNTARFPVTVNISEALQ